MTCPACGTTNEAGRKFCGDCGTKLAAVCPSCGVANAPSTRFCGECGNPMAVAASAVPAPATAPVLAPVAAALPGVPSGASSARPAPVAERRLVSILFADLVGFTSLAEGRDPEAVRELLTRYFDQATDIIERYGGSVEKFIGDAVMAVWGAPVAREDDAERAVRAAIELLDAVRALAPGLQARAGIMTGEAAVTLGATGQGMVAGDLVNTASRLQSVAQPGTVLVGEVTYQATTTAITYAPAGEHMVKGKDATVAAWRAVRVVAQRRGRGRDDRLEAPFVGRDAEIRLLKDLFHATSREQRVRLVSITGQAGIGKSRLAWEFLKYVDGVVEDVWWHEGRSPAYGEGITFWALGEMIRSRARLLETDDPGTTRARIADVVAEYVPDESERRRIEPALLALLGVGEAPAGGQPELFSAWRTFFERLAATGIVALLFEDLQWADSGTLDFIEHLLEWSRNVPILIITLSRPELLDRRPGWGAGRRAFLALDVQPLDETSMRELLAGLAPGLPDAAVRTIISRADGIPLYAVETVRMLVADGRLVPRDGGGFSPVGEMGELAVPNSLHALIAARLDALDPGERQLVQDAAVLGQSFTQDALAAIVGLDRAALDARLQRLVRGDLLQVEVDPRSPERGQYAFVQALIREVAYSTLALRDRRERHIAAARYFESIGDEELVGAVAAHYVAAVRASAAGAEADTLAERARNALAAAGSRAERLGALDQAHSFFVQAADIAADPAERATLLERAAVASIRVQRSDAAIPDLEAALETLRAVGDRSGQARVAGWIGNAMAGARRREEAVTYLESALRDFGDLGDDNKDLIHLVQSYAGASFLTGNYHAALESADRVLAAAERMGDASQAAEALRVKGSSAFNLGRIWEAQALLLGAGRVAREAGLPEAELRSTVILASVIALDSPAEALALGREAIELAQRLGQRSQEIVLSQNAAEDARRVGEWDWAASVVDYIDQYDIDAAAHIANRIQQALSAAWRGALDTDELEGLRAAVTAVEDRDIESSIDDLEGVLHTVNGRFIEAAEAWMKVAGVSDLNAPYALPRAARAAVLGGDPALAQQALDRLAALGTRGRSIDADKATIRAGLAALAGDRASALAGYRTAVATYRELGLAFDEALIGIEASRLVGAAEPEVAGWVEVARATFTRLGAASLVGALERAVARDVAPGVAVGETAGVAET
jgi:class 3 adenylate cyclase/tetratricopeptide (TPR) repeat protein